MVLTVFAGVAEFERALIRLRVDENYVRVAGKWKYLFRAVDKQGRLQKLIITRALAAAGAPVSPQDLEDRTPRRRRS